MHETMRMQDFQVFADGDLRRLELLGEFSDQDPSLVIQQIEDGAASFFVEHGIKPDVIALPLGKRGAKRISFYSVLFRLSRRKNGSMEAGDPLDLLRIREQKPLPAAALRQAVSV